MAECTPNLQAFPFSATWVSQAEGLRASFSSPRPRVIDEGAEDRPMIFWGPLTDCITLTTPINMGVPGNHRTYRSSSPGAEDGYVLGNGKCMQSVPAQWIDFPAQKRENAGKD